MLAVKFSRFRPAVWVGLVIISGLCAASLFVGLVLRQSVDIGRMDGAYSVDGVAPGWLGWNRDAAVFESHHAVRGRLGLAQEISTVGSATRAASISAAPEVLVSHRAPAYKLSFWYRRMGGNQDVSAAYVGYGNAQKTVQKFSLPLTEDWTRTEVVFHAEAQAQQVSFWVLNDVTLQVDDVGIAPLSEIEIEGLAVHEDSPYLVPSDNVMHPTYESEVVEVPVNHGLFTWQRPGVDIGTMDLAPDTLGIAGGFVGLNREPVPFSKSHSLVPGRNGRAQQITTVNNGLTVSTLFVPSSLLGQVRDPAEFTLSFWYRLEAPVANRTWAGVNLSTTETKKNLAVLLPSSEWRLFQTRFVVEDGPAELTLKVFASGVTIQVDDISLTDSSGIAGRVPVVVTKVVQTNQSSPQGTPDSPVSRAGTPKSPSPTVPPGAERSDPFEIRVQQGRLAFLSEHGGMTSVLKEYGLSLSGLVLSWLAVALISLPVGTSVLGGLQGFVAWEPAPADLMWLLWGFAALILGQLAWKRLHTARGVIVALLVFSVGNILPFATKAGSNSSLGYLLVTFYGLGLLVSTALVVHSEQLVKAFRLSLVSAALVNAVAAMAALTGIEPWASLFSAYGRANGFFKDPNVLGPFLSTAILLLEMGHQETATRSRLALVRVIQLILLSGVLLTQSRAAIGALVLSMGVLWFLEVKRDPTRLKKTVRVAAVSLVALSTLAVGFYKVAILSSDRFTVLKDYDGARRFPAQLQGLLYSLSHPVGSGPGTFEGKFGIAAHSLYVRVVTENGWVGFAGLLLLIGLTSARLWRYRKERELIPLAAWWVGMLANSLVIDTVHWRHFWIVLGLTWAVLISREEKEQQARTQRKSTDGGANGSREAGIEPV